MATRHDTQRRIDLLGAEANHQVLTVIRGHGKYPDRTFDTSRKQDIIVAGITRANMVR